MSRRTTHNFIIPDTTDSNLIEILEANFQQLADHNHDGENSAELSSRAGQVFRTIATPPWSAVPDGEGLYTLVIDTTDWATNTQEEGFAVYEGLTPVYPDVMVRDDGHIVLKSNIRLGSLGRKALRLLFF